MDKVLVIIPAYNEALNIERVVTGLQEEYPISDSGCLPALRISSDRSACKSGAGRGISDRTQVCVP